MNFIKTTLLEKFILTLIFCLLILLIANIYKKEGFHNNVSKNIIIKKGNDIFDNYYVNIYDDILNNTTKNNDDIYIIRNNTNFTNKSKILDIGCGTGHHVNLFNMQNKNSAIGIDNSRAMIEKSRENYLDSIYKLCNGLNSLEFQYDAFSHITCLNLTIYYIKNKQQLFNNCYNWLIPHGVLVLNLVNSKLFNAITSLAYDADQKPLQHNCNKQLTKCNIKFNTLDYKSDFKLNNNIDANTTSLNEPNAILKESFISKDSNNIRINEHKLYMSTRQSIINMAMKLGFIMKSEQKYSDSKYKENYLYIFEKP